MEISRPKKIIILEPNAAHKDYLRSVVSHAGDLAFCFKQEASCLDNLFQLDPALIVMGSFPKERSIRFMNALRAIDCELPVILLSQDPAVRQYLAVNPLGNMKVVDFAWDGPALEASVQSALSKRQKDEQWNRLPFIVGKNPDVVKMKTLLPELGRSTENVFIQGEKGVGKELLARAIHVHSKNGDIFIKIDAPALAVVDMDLRLSQILKQTLGAHQQKKSTNGSSKAGTLYIHEIGDMPSHLQAELLLITDETGLPLVSGDIGSINVFRVIVGSSKDLGKAVASQRFRKDLFYRLNTLQVAIPPLRCRKDDISLLTDFFTYKFCKDFDKSYFELSAAIKDRFQDYRWPGNIHELEGCCQACRDDEQRKGIFTRVPGRKITGGVSENPQLAGGCFLPRRRHRCKGLPG